MMENILRHIYLRSAALTMRLHHSVILAVPASRLTTVNAASGRDQRHSSVGAGRVSDFSTAVQFMSGHSKWQNIRHIKAANDAAKSTAFSKYARMMKVAIREGNGNDPRFNNKLAHIVDVAKRANMPIARIESLLKEKVAKDNLVEFILEAKGPGGCFLIMEGLTDNLKRTRQTVRSYMNKVGASLVENGAKHSFDYKGVINVDPSSGGLTLESAVDVAIEVGAEDVKEVTDEENENMNALQFLCEPIDFYAVKSKLEERGIMLKTSELKYLPFSRVQLSDDQLSQMARLSDLINEDPDIMKCYDNIQ